MLSKLSLTRYFFSNSNPTGLDCNGYANGNVGCGVQTTAQNNYGPAFNNNGGGWCVKPTSLSFTSSFKPRA
jgi:hypothetical protein